MYFVSVTLQALVYGTQVLLIAVGLYLVYTSSRIFHLGIGAIGAASAYAVYFGLSSGWNPALAFIFGAIVAVLLGVLSAYLLEPFAEKREPLFGLIVSFALGMMIESVLGMIFGSGGKNFQTGVLPTIDVWGAGLDRPGAITIVLGIALTIVSGLAVHFTDIGRLLRGVAENSPLSLSLGVDNRKVRMIACILAALVSAAIVSLAGWHTALVPAIGFHLLVSAFIALLAGGVGDLRGTVIASYVLALVPTYMIAYSDRFSENWWTVFVFLIAAVLLSFKPQGLFGRKIREA